METLDRDSVRSWLVGAWVLFVMMLGYESKVGVPIKIVTPLLTAVVGAHYAQEFFSHTSNFAVSFFMVYFGGLTLSYPKAWWVWLAGLTVLFASFLFSGTRVRTSSLLILSYAALPLLLAIGELLKPRLPRVGVPLLWAVVSAISYNAIIELVPGAFPNYGDPIDFWFGAAGALVSYLTMYVIEKTA